MSKEEQNEIIKDYISENKKELAKCIINLIANITNDEIDFKSSLSFANLLLQYD